MTVFRRFQHILKAAFLTFVFCVSSAFAVDCTAPWVPNDLDTDCVCGGLLYDDNDDGTYSADECHESKFEVKTVKITQSDVNRKKNYVAFQLSAQGTFYVDWGDGSGVKLLTGTNNTNQKTYSHTYAANAEGETGYTIRFASENVTAYNTASNTPSIRFGYSSDGSYSFSPTNNGEEGVYSTVYSDVWRTKIKEASGSLGRLLPSLGTGSNQYPKFYYTFGYCDNLDTIDADLFRGMSNGGNYMFQYTFVSSGLTSIPENLFSDFTSASQGMFYSTFYGCTGLRTVQECYDGTTLKTDFDTKQACENANYEWHVREPIPANLFSNISGQAGYEAFHYTFASCSGLTSIPENLFGNISSADYQAFYGTFNGCGGLTRLPNNLFPKITSSNGGSTFTYMFKGCTNLGTDANMTYIPATLFRNRDSGSYGSSAMYNIFDGTALATSCPEGTKQYVTGFESDWGGKVACIPIDSIVCTAGQSGETDSCVACANAADCPVATLHKCSQNDYIGNLSSSSCVQKNRYNITYNNVSLDDGGMNDAPSEYWNDEPTPLPKPTRDGYAFMGWYDNAQFSGSTISEIEIGSVGDVVLYAKWLDAITIETTGIDINNSSNDYFAFELSAKGTFYVDWGDNTAIETITKTDTSLKAYSHTYKTAGDNGRYIVQIASSAGATLYDTSTSTPTIRFGQYSSTSYRSTNENSRYVYSNVWRTKVKKVSGSFTRVFPVRGTKSSQYPKFYYTFGGCTELTTIGANLFKNMSTAGSYMFQYTFYGCTGLRTIQECYDGTTLKPDINTKQACENANYEWRITEPIPENLFGDFTSAASSMFFHTFDGCTGLTKLPNNLFSKITSGYSFSYMFYNCTNLGTDANITYIPATLFRNLDGSGAMSYIFSGTALATSCPEGTRQYVTGFEGDWSGKVACIPIDSIVCPTGQTGETDSCVTCANAADCPVATLHKCSQSGYIGDVDSSSCIQKHKYSITYDNVNFDGVTGMNDAPSEYWNNETTPLPSLSRDGYMFVGWYRTNAYGEFFTSLEPGLSEDLVLHAKWVAKADGVKINTVGITQTDINNGTNYVAFRLGTQGWFFVDWGDGSPVETIKQNTTSIKTYSHTYETTSGNDGYTITIASENVTGYGNSTSSSAIQFGQSSSYSFTDSSANNDGKSVMSGVWRNKIKGVTGSLGRVFPVLDATTAGKYPIFYYTFGYCENFDTINDDLFDGISTGAPSMFSYTFSGCTGLRTTQECYDGTTLKPDINTKQACEDANYEWRIKEPIPENLFANISGTASSMFNRTFSACSGLTSIPENLFANISVPASSLFSGTFENCTGLTSIPENLFSNISGVASYMFYYTFSGCTGLTSIPGNLFASISGAASSMFDYTFNGCTHLTSIPENLFANISAASSYMFRSTFKGCVSLTKLPNNLFPKIPNANASYMLQDMFSGCYNLGTDANVTYIPATLFANMSYTPYGTNAMSNIFANTAFVTTCPDGTKRYETGFENYWNSKVACIPIESELCKGGQKMNASTRECESCENPGVGECPEYAKIWCYNGEYNMATGKCPPKTYTITYHNVEFSGETVVNENPGSYTALDDTIVLAEPVRSGYVFDKWCSIDVTECPSENVITQIATDAALDLDIYATWAQVHTITYHNVEFDGAVNTNPATFTRLDTITLVGGLARSGYVFDKWCSIDTTECPTANVVTEIVYGTDQDVDVYATWTPAHTIRYHNVEFADENIAGMVNAPLGYVTDVVTTLPTPARDGHMFDGWYDNAQFAGNKLTSTEIGWSGDLDLYAKWLGGVTIKTTKIYANDYVAFGLSAKGTFYVDWGDNSGVELLPGTDNTNLKMYSHTYQNASGDDGYTITIVSDNVTAYSTSYSTPAIIFGDQYSSTSYSVSSTNNNGKTVYTDVWRDKIKEISGSFGDLVPVLGTESGQYPSFYSTFRRCAYLDKISDNLFRGISIGKRYMFYDTFENCTSLTSIPDNLFGDVSDNVAEYEFYGTFKGCTGLTKLPNNLFPKITSVNGNYMFASMFNGCTNLGTDANITYIPATLFRNMDSASYGNNAMISVFYDTSLAKKCPTGTKQYVTGFEDYWHGNVACVPIDSIVCPAGQTGETDSCVACANADDCPVATLHKCSQEGYVGNVSASSCIQTQTYNITYNNITFDGETVNGMTGAPTEYTNNVITPLPKPTRDGYMFLGWYDNAQFTGEGITYLTGGSVGDRNLHARWIEAITVKTTGINATSSDSDYFAFQLFTQGTFYVDWGDDSPIEKIVKTNVYEETYSHTYDTTQDYTIRIGSENVTAYGTSSSKPAIAFGDAEGESQNGAYISHNDTRRMVYGNVWRTKIKEVSGSLGKVFPQLGSSTDQIPIFTNTFARCTALDTIGADLFAGISKGDDVASKFSYAFAGCTSLTSIPENLFGSVSGYVSDYAFSSTFSGCTGLTKLPNNLFPKITYGTQYSFLNMFNGCTNLGTDVNNTYIPATLFRNIDSMSSGTSAMSNIFYGTALATTCPDGTRQYVTGFENDWGGKVACIPTNAIVCAADKKLETVNGVDKCVACSGANCPAISELHTCEHPADSIGNYKSDTCVPVGEHSITYHNVSFDGETVKGMTGAPTRYTNTEATPLPTPTRDGYMFMGWYDNDEFDGEGVTSLDIGWSGDLNLYARWLDAITITTTGIDIEDPENNYFAFALGVNGEFYVDWGDGSPEERIVANIGNYTSKVFSHTYDTPAQDGDYIVRIRPGYITSYRDYQDSPAIRFGDVYTSSSYANSVNNSGRRVYSDKWRNKVKKVHGSFGKIFPVSGTSRSQYPRFYYTFGYCENLEEVDANLFKDISAAGDYMFQNTFSGCTGLTSIPENLFGNFTSGATWMFDYTFSGCTGLTKLPNNLFSKITSADKTYEFNRMFDGCTNLGTDANVTYIPATLFRNMSSTPYGTFAMSSIFNNTALATGCPSGTKQYITGFEDKLGGKVACIPINEIVCAAGEKLRTVNGVDKCVACSGADCPAISELHTCEHPTNSIGNYKSNTCVPIGTHNITYHNVSFDGETIGGMTGAPTQYTNNVVTPLPTPTREGYRFAGWYDNAEFTGEGVTSLSIGWSGDLNLYAKWLDLIIITTTGIDAADSSNNYFAFQLSAQGTFYVDWGDDSPEETIKQNTTGVRTYSHTYETTKDYTIKIAAENVVAYTSNSEAPVIRFGSRSASSDCLYSDNNNSRIVCSDKWRTKVKTVSGSFGKVFPVFGVASRTQYPSFYYTFGYCENLEQIDANLFDGISVGGPSMFYGTFAGCTSLTSISENLFNKISFADGAETANSMFLYTFAGCTGLTSIPENLFGSATRADYNTFKNTFSDCTGLTKLPNNLFPKIPSAAKSYVFANMFDGCTDLGTDANITYIPATLFANMSNSPFGNYAMNNIFNNTALATTCPDGTKQYTTEFESYWNSKVACMPTDSILCKAGQKINLNTRECEPCTAGVGICPTSAKIWCYSGGEYDTETYTCPEASSHIITYDYNGGSILWEDVLETQPINYQNLNPGYESGALNDGLLLNRLSKDGYIFVGWCLPNESDTTCAANNESYAYFDTDPVTGELVDVVDYGVKRVFNTGPNTDITLTARWKTAEFEVNVELPELDNADDAQFCFAITAAGDFWVDWDAVGDWTSEAESIGGAYEHIVKSVTAGDSNESRICHTYSLGENTTRNHTIKLGGLASQYVDFDTTGDGAAYPAIAFNTDSASMVTGISGSLGHIFPTLNNGAQNTDNPRFYNTFNGCSNLTALPNDGMLFDGVTKPASGMFTSTFSVAGITSIPGNLFASISGPIQDFMFMQTFAYCPNLTGAIPENLFGRVVNGEYVGLTGSAPYAFYGTFFTGITEIPANLFGRTVGNQYYGISGGANAEWMFTMTFGGTNISSIPNNLFAGIDHTASYMFYYTFYGNNNLTALPVSLFPNITLTDDNILLEEGPPFMAMFAYCPKLTGSVPYTLFANMDDTDYVPGTMYGIFDGDTLLYTSAAQCEADGLAAYNGWDNTFRNDWVIDDNTGAKAISCVPVYDITYNYGGGTILWEDMRGTQSKNYQNLHPNYQIGSLKEGLLLNRLSKDGYIFVGWCLPNESDTTCAAHNESYAFFDVDTVTGDYIADYGVKRTFATAPISDIALTARWVESKFEVEIDLPEADWHNNVIVKEFCFKITAAGDFWVDWDAVGDWTAEAESIGGAYKHIVRQTAGNDNESTICHTYSLGENTTRNHTIKLGGLASQYVDFDWEGNNKFPAISFDAGTGKTMIAEISGSLGHIFPTLEGNANTNNPRFNGTFKGLTGLTALPDDGMLFDGVTKPATSMFNQTFLASGINNIPEDLFGRVVNNQYVGLTGQVQNSMFEDTFNNCSNLTVTIPEDLFGRVVNGEYVGLTGSAQFAFAGMFKDSGITEIKEKLFGRTIDGQYYGISGGEGAVGLFEETFINTGITKVPDNLFAGINKLDRAMFESTFEGNESLTKLPDSLFPNITSTPTSAEAFNADFGPFWAMFARCPNLTGYVPYTLFANISDADYRNYTMFEIFDGTDLYTEPEQCPSGTVVYNGWDNTFRNDWVIDDNTGAKAISCISPYTITYHNVEFSGETVVNNNPSVYTALDGTIVLTNPTRDGYAFRGWCSVDVAECPVASIVTSIASGTNQNVDLYATWTRAYQCTNGQYLKYDTETEELSIEPCDPNYYCVAGTWTIYDIDPITHTAGMNACVAGSTSSAGSSTCTCTPGYSWDAANNTCNEIVCPKPSQDDESDWSPEGQSYGNTVNECVAGYWYGSGEEMAMAFFKYNPDTEQYDAAYTPAYKICDLDDMTQLVEVWSNDGLVALLQYVSGEEDIANVGNLFTPVESGQSAPEMPEVFNRCCPEGFVCCGAGTYIDYDAIGTDDQCPICPAGSYCEGKQWDPETTFASGETKCGTGTYNATPGAKSVAACLTCPADYPLSTLGTTDIAQCYANCPQPPACVDNALGCAYTNQNQTTKTFGNTCGTSITGCNGGYTATNIGSFGDKMDTDSCSLGLSADQTCQFKHMLSDGTDESIWMTPGQFAVGFYDELITSFRGIESCNNTAGSDTSVAARISNGSFVPTANGANCWIKVSQIGGMEVNASWVYVKTYSDEADCKLKCGRLDYYGLVDQSTIDDVLSALTMTMSQNQVCAANVVNIAWDGVAEPGDAGMCIYGKSLTTPQVKPEQAGKLFLGWKPVLATNNSLNP